VHSGNRLDAMICWLLHDQAQVVQAFQDTVNPRWNFLRGSHLAAREVAPRVMQLLPGMVEGFHGTR